MTGWREKQKGEEAGGGEEEEFTRSAQRRSTEYAERITQEHRQECLCQDAV